MEKNKELALKKLKERKANPPKQIDNSSLYAGSPMYYYCKSCGHVAAILPEAHTESVPQLCKECQSMKDNGWIDYPPKKEAA